MDSFPFFPRGISQDFFHNSVSDSREFLVLFFSQPLLSSSPLPHSTGVKGRPFLEGYQLIKWGLLESVFSTDCQVRKNWGKHSHTILLVTLNSGDYRANQSIETLKLLWEVTVEKARLTPGRPGIYHEVQSEVCQKPPLPPSISHCQFLIA